MTISMNMVILAIPGSMTIGMMRGDIRFLSGSAENWRDSYGQVLQ